MTDDFLDWTHSCIGRMDHIDSTYFYAPEAEDPLKKIASPTAGKCSQRLFTMATAGTLPFLTMPYMDSLRQDIMTQTPYLRSFKHMLLVGIGGSALGAKALQKAFYREQDLPEHNGPCLWISDNVETEQLAAWMHSLPPEETLLVVASKSGTTIETIAQYFILREWLQKKLGAAWKKHVCIITDTTSGFLRDEAREHALLSFAVPEHLGGRYSVLSAVGLVPAAFLGIDWQALVQGAQDVFAPLVASISQGQAAVQHTLAGHAAWSLARWNAVLMAHDYDELIFFSYIPRLAYLGQWFCQLWAESLGKDARGSTPITALGTTDQHSTQQLFLDGPRNKACFFIMGDPKEDAAQDLFFPQDIPEQWQYLRGKPFSKLLPAAALGTRMALAEHAVPLLVGNVGTDAYATGKLIALLELSTVLTGCLLHVNPLDQPAVERGKHLANAHLGAEGYAVETEQLQHFTLKKPVRQTF